MLAEIPSVILNTGAPMPRLGFGVYKVPDDETRAVVGTALEAGYRSIDTATLYRNEEGVGQAVVDSGVAREDLFITTKLWNADHGYDAALRAFDVSLQRLGMDYVDLYLIHWPCPAKDLYVETWKALERIHAEGWARAIGVSNFKPAHIDRLLEESGTVPAVNQVELHPRFPQKDLRDYDAGNGIVTEAWSPLGRAKGLLDRPEVAEIAERHGRTPAQVVLRWHLQLGNVVIPKSATPSRMVENLDVFGFELDGADLRAIAALDDGVRVGSDPDDVN